ncbi:MAG: ribosomal-processing cysteine protease Prp [Clostridia bacterium]|nr:ribosomal-processing cysteine protease Prp [Clostridia bacterium]
MIKLKLSLCRLLADGHANQNVCGSDIVCAAVSTLITTLVRRLLSLERSGQANKVRFQVERGHAGICCEDSIDARMAFAFAETGLRALAEDYPDYICIDHGRPKKSELFRKGR